MKLAVLLITLSLSACVAGYPKDWKAKPSPPPPECPTYALPCPDTAV